MHYFLRFWCMISMWLSEFVLGMKYIYFMKCRDWDILLLNNSYTTTIVYRHSLIYGNIHAAVKMKELFGRFGFNQTALTSDVYMQHFLFYVSSGNQFLYNCRFACELVSNSWLMFIFFTLLGTSHWIGGHVSGWSTAVYLG